MNHVLSIRTAKEIADLLWGAREAAENLPFRRSAAQARGMAEEHTTTEPVLSGPLTWQEICARYPDEWVALVEIDWVDEDDLDFRSARVAGHGKTRREPLDQARPLREHYDEIGHFFTGPIRVPLRTYIMP